MTIRSSSYLSWILAAVVASALGVQCSSADPAPPMSIGAPDASGGTAGMAGMAGGSTGGSSGEGGTGGSGIIVGGAGGGTPNFTCDDPTDTDGDGIADEIEGTDDPDGDGKPSNQDDDSDGDGVLDAEERGHDGTNPCAEPANSDNIGDGYDFLDLDSDGDTLPDDQEVTCPGVDCRTLQDCDNDPEGVLDIIEVAAQSDPCDGMAPANAPLFFIVPYRQGPQQKRFSFSTGIRDADIYFLIDTTNSMQPAIDNVRDSLDTEIIPKVLNGDPTARPPIPPVPGAWVGIGDFKDVPWAPWGIPGDRVYGFRFDLMSNGTLTYGNVSAPVDNGGTLEAPANVRSILNSLTASGGGDSPEATTQALWLASNNQDYRAVGGGEPWPPNEPDTACSAPPCFDPQDWRQNCEDPSRIGRACFRPGKLPVFVVITDAGFHDGPTTSFDYIASPGSPPGGGKAVNGTKSYQDVLTELSTISAKIVGVPVNTGLPGQARSDLVRLAEDTGSFYFQQQFGAGETPLVAEETGSGDVSTEVVRLIGLLAGLGVNNVTTVTTNYDCPGSVDCDGDAVPDPEYHNRTDMLTGMPFDASQLIVSVRTVPSNASPPPYGRIDNTTFYNVRGDQVVEFEVTAENEILEVTVPVVVRALIRVETPSGQALGGADGVKVVYLVIPPFIPAAF